MLLFVELGDADLRAEPGGGEVLDEAVAAVLEPKRGGVVAQAARRDASGAEPPAAG